MKYIEKLPEPAILTEERESLQQHESNPGLEHLTSDAGTAILESLFNEQGYICCYCGNELKNNDFHREHLVPQSMAPGRKLDYSNILASCYAGQKSLEPDESGRIDSRQRGKAEHCGDHRPPNTLLEITPLDADCEDHFKYTLEGDILPTGIGSTQDKANSTIHMLGLNCDRLKRFRKKALNSIFEETGDPNQPYKIPDESIADWYKTYFSQKQNGKYKQFCFVVMYFLNTYFP